MKPIDPLKCDITVLARRIISTSIAYYSLDTSLVDDPEFDTWCKAMHDRWDELDKWTQFKLGDPHAIKASGFHIKASQQDVAGVSSMMKRLGILTHVIAVSQWYRKKVNDSFIKWTPLDQISWDYAKPIH